MRKQMRQLWTAGAVCTLLLAGCGSLEEGRQESQEETVENSLAQTGEAMEEENQMMTWTDSITELDEDFSAVSYEGDYGFDAFLRQGGASSDSQVVQFLTETMLSGTEGLSFQTEAFGCSTISAQAQSGGYLFGRNFDWNRCEALIVGSRPTQGYASISTVNVGFIRQGAGMLTGLALNSDQILTMAALYAPLDGMNEAGLAVSVNMIEDNAQIEQDTDRPDLTTTTAVRLMLNQAADVEEAVALLGQYDLHGSMGMMIHFAIADADGRSVAVEYIDNEMIVTETPVVTNFYLAEGEKQGIGTSQSHERYDTLMNLLEEQETLTTEGVRDALDSVSKHNFGEFESTEWSIVYDQQAKEARYYHREDYTKSWTFQIAE
ncbi:MAG: C45 family peptidase [Eubacteriales bacterium]|nr:C45 family peptidase [Eubacteriales bacterium]